MTVNAPSRPHFGQTPIAYPRWLTSSRLPKSTRSISFKHPRRGSYVNCIPLTNNTRVASDSVHRIPARRPLVRPCLLIIRNPKKCSSEHLTYCTYSASMLAGRGQTVTVEARFSARTVSAAHDELDLANYPIERFDPCRVLNVSTLRITFRTWHFGRSDGDVTIPSHLRKTETANWTYTSLEPVLAGQWSPIRLERQHPLWSTSFSQSRC